MRNLYLQDYNLFPPESPIFNDFEYYQALKDSIWEEITRYKNTHPGKFYDFFENYVYMRHLAYIRIGELSINDLTQEEYEGLTEEQKKNIVKSFFQGQQKLIEMFQPEMTTDEAFKKAYEIVEQYWWPEEQDITDVPNANEEALHYD